MKQHPNPLVSSSTDNVEMSIKEFLGRPRICPGGSIVWNTSSVRGDNLMTMTLPSPMITTGIWADKLNDVYGFKATTVIRLQSNAQQFQGGILLLRYIPAYGHIDNQRLGVIAGDIRFMSQLPSVRLNIAECDEAVIRVPFISPELFWNKTSPINWGAVFITVYSPLTSDNVGLTCWCHFEDIEINIPSAASGRISSTVRRRVRRDPADQEVPRGLLSGPLSVLSDSIGMFGDNIPTISSVTAPVSWFVDACSKAASAFGYSKPIDPSTRSSVVRRIFSHAWNSDVADTSDSMGLTISNKISHMPGFAGMDVDEMSLQYICGTPSYIGNITWADTQASGVTLWQLAVCPLNTATLYNKVIPTTTTSTTVLIPTPYAYCASMFQSWRGSLIYKFYAAKSMFHVGRLMIAFRPSIGSTPFSLSETEACYRWIWDIRDSFDYEVTIPYVSSVPWRSTDASANISAIGTISVFVLNELTAPATTTSTIDIVVESRAGPDFELAAPILGSSNYVPILAASGPILEGSSEVNTRKNGSRRRLRDISSKDDLAQGGPVNPTALNRAHTHRARPTDDDLKFKYVSRRRDQQKLRSNQRDLKYSSIVAQSGETTQLAHFNTSAPGPSTPKDLSSFNALYTMGESVKSLRQLLKRSGHYARSGFTTGTLQGFQLEPFYPILRQAYAGNAALLDFSAINAGVVYYSDWWSRVAPLFALFRGGMVHKYAASGVDCEIFFKLFNQINNVPPLYSANAATWTASSTAGENMVHQYVPSSTQNAVDALIPFYGQSQSYPVGYYSAAQMGSLTYAPSNLYYRNYSRLVVTANYKTVPQNTRCFGYRSIADDMSLGCFLGVIPLYNAAYTSLG